MMRSTITLMAALSLSLWMAGCDDSGSSPGATPTPDAATGAGGAGGGAGGEGGAGGAGGGVEEQALARSAGRMTVEQLARSIPIVTEGLRWTEDFGQGETDMLEILAPTLGAPDYVRVTAENLEPTLIVAKFMADASNRICMRWATRDQALPAAERSLVTHDGPWESTEAAHVEANLRALLLRFFARKVAEDDRESLADLSALFTTAADTAAPGMAARDGWLAVCIALMTDPEFILY